MPFIGGGYGEDTDCYRVAEAARWIAETGEYHFSRIPGYPVHEFVTSLVVERGAMWTNATTAGMSVCAVLFFRAVLRQWGVRDGWLLALTFAFTPVVYIGSTSTIDYLWAITFGLASFYFVARRPLVAGILLGLAVGSRLTSVGLAVPLVVYGVMSWRDEGANVYKRLTVLLSAGLGVAFAFYLPMLQLLQSSPQFLSGPERNRALGRAVANGTLQVWGAIGSVALIGLLLALLLHRRRTWARLTDRDQRRIVVVCLCTIGIYSVAFISLPLEAGYLIPAVPFALALLGLITPTTVLRPALVLVVLSSFFVSLDSESICVPGPIFRDRDLRQASMRRAWSIDHELARASGKPLLVSGPLAPQLRLLHGDDESEVGPRYVNLVESAALYDGYVRDGYSVFFLPGADARVLRRVELDIRALGAKEFTVNVTEDAMEGWSGPCLRFSAAAASKTRTIASRHADSDRDGC